MQVQDTGSVLPANVAIGTNTVNSAFETIRINGGRRRSKNRKQSRRSNRKQKSPVGKTKRRRTNRSLPLLHWKCV
jgi:hypothetical protein